ncbi:ATP-dependent Clp protease adapter ClpS [Arthrobacter sp. MYb227]|uniref:ATP-dependent Clp protease adapter ClpS n=1 Tax=Arthrobacter sp. MYb227 TaxID=1848601 RepID=UPI000CFC6BD7|nr:ATP-dependent Clp protease adapter ClpS [Arthrobacter sp. MYb227]
MTAMPDVLEHVEQVQALQVDQPYVLIVWNDPVNLMSYVSYVFRSYFGYSETRAEELMMQVHQQGRSVVASGNREKIESDVAAMHGFGLWATLTKADAA